VSPLLVLIAIGDIVVVGVALIVMTVWPEWRRMKALERERDTKAREILERWLPADRCETS